MSCLEQAGCQWDLSPLEKGLITSVVFVGMMLGSYTWGAIADAKGRRFGFCGTAVFTAIFGFGSALAPNYWVSIVENCARYVIPVLPLC